MQFENYKMTIKLLAQSPMIHFQGKIDGATLRGSELKPKLDRFLTKKIENWNPKNGVDKKSIAYIDKEKKALKYKVTIMGENGESLGLNEENNKKKFNIIYGDRTKTLVLRNLELTILCMNQPLQELIKEYIIEFFAVTNFGYMQNKGFGSFMPEEYLNDINECKLKDDIAKWLKNKCGAENCYYIEFDKKLESITSYEECFREIKDFYDLLKTGRNHNGYSRAYIYQYMHNKKINNEKAWMKSEGIAPALKKCGDKRCIETSSNDKKNKRNIQNSRYVRALLGVASKVEYLNALDKNNFSEKVIVNIREKSKNIERMDSPIFFKIIDRCVFICSNRISIDIYDKTFIFSEKVHRPQKNKAKNLAIINSNEKGKSIKVPKKEELQDVGFTIDDLLDEYIKYYNGVKQGEDGKYLRPSEKNKAQNGNYAVKNLAKNKYVRRWKQNE